MPTGGLESPSSSQVCCLVNFVRNIDNVCCYHYVIYIIQAITIILLYNTHYIVSSVTI